MSASEARETKENSSFTFLAYFNYDGREKFPLIVIGHSRELCPSGRHSGRDLSIDDFSNSRAWMAKELFLTGLNALIATLRR